MSIKAAETASRYGALMKSAHDFFLFLRALGEEVHAGSGLSGAMPAILERLKNRGPETVPDIAAARGVARQSVQVLVNGLLEQGLVEARANPRHRRSFLIAITPAGEKRLAALRQREAKLLGAIRAPIPAADVATTAQTLAALESYLRSAEGRRHLEAAGAETPSKEN